MLTNRPPGRWIAGSDLTGECVARGLGILGHLLRAVLRNTHRREGSLVAHPSRCPAGQHNVWWRLLLIPLGQTAFASKTAELRVICLGPRSEGAVQMGGPAALPTLTPDPCCQPAPAPHPTPPHLRVSFH